VNGLCRWDGHRLPGRVKVASREDKIRQTTPPGRQSLALGGLREATDTPMSGCHHPRAIPKSDGNASHSHHFPHSILFVPSRARVSLLLPGGPCTYIPSLTYRSSSLYCCILSSIVFRNKSTSTLPQPRNLEIALRHITPHVILRRYRSDY
jgi:hypothetical protein